MKLTLTKYKFYKDSGSDWLGEVPEHWLSIRIKDVIKHIDQGWSPNAENRTIEKGEWGVLKLSAISNGKYYEINHKALSGLTELKHQYIVTKGDLLLTRSNTPELVGDSCLVLVQPTFNLMYSDLIYCLTIDSKKVVDRYLNYFICSASFRWMKTISARGLNTSMVKISQGIICRWNIFSPPLLEQKAIADYLDTKTSQIDRKIDLLTQKATLYSNLKQSLINETVTRGLDKSVPMKDSEIEWLGEVPEHWEFKRLKDIANIQNSNVDKKLYEYEVPVKLCNYVDVYKNEFISASLNFMEATASESEIKQFTIRKGDVFITKDSETCDDIAIPALATESLEGVLCGYHLAQLRTKEKIFLGAYLFRLFQAKSYGFRFVISAKGITRVGLGQSAIADSLTPVPPLTEQKAIADYLDTKTAQIDQIIQTINTQIEKLKELRKTLINDVVTGKIKQGKRILTLTQNMLQLNLTKFPCSWL